jgi:hypothetical protein
MTKIHLRLSPKAYAELDHRLDIVAADEYNCPDDEVEDYKALVEMIHKVRPDTHGAVTLAVTLDQMKLVRDELDYSLGLDREPAEERAIRRAVNRIDHYIKQGVWPEPNRKSGSPWPASVRAEAEQLVRDTVKHCCRVARRKEFDLGLPSDWKPTVRISWSENRSRSRGGKGSRGLYGGYGGISIVLAHRVPKDGLGGGRHLEYSHIEKEPVIGAFTTLDWRNTVRAVVAHEVAHAIQHWLQWHGTGRHRRIDYRTPHGIGWQRLYALLRHEVVNPRLKADAEPAPIPPLPVMADKPARRAAVKKVATRKKPVRKPVGRILFTL